jgi:hypothetical protein
MTIAQHLHKSSDTVCTTHADVSLLSEANDLNGASSTVSDIESAALAWCAGFADGEGCITLAKIRRTCGNRVNYRTRVYIPQNCLLTLQEFQDRVDVHCNLVKMPHRESYTRTIYQLIYDGVHALNLLKKLRPFLVRKAAEADVIFEYYRTCEPSRHYGPKGVPSHIWLARERCYEALRCLK